MARVFAPINIAIWQDPEWRSLPFVAQGLYTTLWAHPGLSYCGVVDWRPGRIAAMSGDLTSESVRAIGDCLQARHFIVVDEDTEECLIRSWVRFDGLLKQPRMAISYANAYAEVASGDLRGVLAHEAERLQTRSPELAGWGKDEVQSILSMPKIDPKLRPVPSDPYPQGFPIGLGIDLGETSPNVSGSVSVPPTPSPAPTPLTPAPESSRRKPQRPFPEKFEPNDAHRAKAQSKNLDVQVCAEKFRGHALSQDRRCASWDQAFHNWLNNEKPGPPVRVLPPTVKAPSDYKDPEQNIAERKARRAAEAKAAGND